MKLAIKHQKYTKRNYFKFTSSRHYFCLKGIYYFNTTEINNIYIYKR